VNALKDLGVVEATANTRNNKVTVEFDPAVVSLKEIQNEINDIGFRALEPKNTDG